MTTIYEPIAKALLIAGMFPLDPKSRFVTLADMKDLGTLGSRAFTYYEMMNSSCVETQTDYQWKEVDKNYSGGVLEENFQYPPNTITDGVDYSMRYFNFVPRHSGTEIGSSGVLVVGDYVIFKGYISGNKNVAQFLEVNDLVMGHFSESVFMTSKYLGGPIININSWAVMEQKNPTVHNTPGEI